MRLNLIFVGFSAFFIAGCAPIEEVDGNKNYAVVKNIKSLESARLVAEAHCEQYRRSALLQKSNGFIAKFDCVD